MTVRKSGGIRTTFLLLIVRGLLLQSLRLQSSNNDIHMNSNNNKEESVVHLEEYMEVKGGGGSSQRGGGGGMLVGMGGSEHHGGRLSPFRGLRIATSFRLAKNRSRTAPTNGSDKKQHQQQQQPWTSFITLAKQKKFDEILHILNDTSSDCDCGEKEQEWLDEVEIDTNGSALHYILSLSNPPLTLVDKLCSVMKVANSVNAIGQTPLHVASYHHCNVLTMQRLLEQSASAAQIRDEFYRCPLHYACMMSKGGSKNNKEQEKDLALLLQLLVEAYPQARYLKDVNGQTPIDLARLNLSKSLHVHFLSSTMADAHLYPLKNTSMHKKKKEKLVHQRRSSSLRKVVDLDDDDDVDEEVMDVTVVTEQSTITDEIPREIVSRWDCIEEDSISDLECPKEMPMIIQPMATTTTKKKKKLATKRKKKTVRDLDRLECCEI